MEISVIILVWESKAQKVPCDCWNYLNLRFYIYFYRLFVTIFPVYESVGAARKLNFDWLGFFLSRRQIFFFVLGVGSLLFFEQISVFFGYDFGSGVIDAQVLCYLHKNKIYRLYGHSRFEKHWQKLIFHCRANFGRPAEFVTAYRWNLA